MLFAALTRTYSEREKSGRLLDLKARGRLEGDYAIWEIEGPLSSLSYKDEREESYRI